MTFKWISSNNKNSSLFFNFDILHLHLSTHSIYSFVWNKSTEILDHIILATLVYLIVCLSVYKLTFLSRGHFLKLVNNLRLPKPNILSRVLFVISHPDDECMFFGPLILSLTKQLGCNVYLLCLSNGNFEKQGNLRRKELWRSCSLLGIPSSNIILVNATNLQDDPNKEWKVESVANLILNTVECLDIKAVVTFDRDGVSQHPNHCAVYYATASLCLNKLLPKDCKIFTLDSINILRKYMSIADLLWTFIMSTNWCILSFKEASTIRDAMKQHKSQMKWFRWIYIYFSRYMFINSMREVNLFDVELEMQIQDS